MLIANNLSDNTWAIQEGKVEQGHEKKKYQESNTVGEKQEWN